MVVKALACHERLVDVRDRVKAEFGIEITREALYKYMPDHNPNMDTGLKAMFEKVEAEFLEEGRRVPFNNRNRRNVLRERVFWRNERNPVIQRDLLNDAARDHGGLFAQKRVEAIVEDAGLSALTDNLVNASNEDLARILSATPDEMIDPDVLEFMIAQGFRKPRPALPVASIVDGEIVDGS